MQPRGREKGSTINSNTNQSSLRCYFCRSLWHAAGARKNILKLLTSSSKKDGTFWRASACQKLLLSCSNKMEASDKHQASECRGKNDQGVGSRTTRRYGLHVDADDAMRLPPQACSPRRPGSPADLWPASERPLRRLRIAQKLD